ncbi:MAG: MFS transporter, partial [Anaerolineaceae bacterium]|nr:MFS transporter [Anaerolineaceae bacterium]
SWTSTFGFIPILANQLGANDVTQSMLMSMNIAVVLFGNLAATTLIRKMRSRQLILTGIIFLCSGIFIAALAHSLLAIFVAQICSGMAIGISSPILMGKSIEKVKNEERTTAMGLHQAVYAIGMFSGPWMSGLIADAIGIQPMFAMTGLMCLIFGVIGVRKLE